MRFSMPGLMPTTAPKFNDDNTVHIRGAATVVLDRILLELNGLPIDLTGKIIKLIVTDKSGVETSVPTAVEIKDPATDGEVSITFAEGARGPIGEDDGMHKWVLVEEVDGVNYFLIEGHAFRTKVSLPH